MRVTCISVACPSRRRRGAIYAKKSVDIMSTLFLALDYCTLGTLLAASSQLLQPRSIVLHLPQLSYIIDRILASMHKKFIYSLEDIIILII
jgi:hypothetical protein